MNKLKLTVALLISAVVGILTPACSTMTAPPAAPAPVAVAATPAPAPKAAPAPMAPAAPAAAPRAASTGGKSPHETTSAKIDGNRVTIIYGRPYSKDPKTGEPRKIWGALVPYDKIWRTGSDEATTLITQQPINLGGTVIPAGIYTLFTFPTADGAAKLVVNKTIGQWGIDPYDEKQELARIDLKKDALDTPVDQFTISVGKNPAGGGLIKLMWETTQYSVGYKIVPPPLVTFPAPSPTATFKQRVGLTDIEIVYSRPSLKGRKAFGGLAPYGEVWRTGANNATRITFSTPVKLEGMPVPAGTYEVFSIPGQDEWTVILQKASKQWGAYTYKQENDTLRVKVKPTAPSVMMESFTIGLADLRDESATLYFAWENTRVPVQLTVDVAATIVPQIEAAMASPDKKSAGFYVQAADFYWEHNLDLAKAAAWMDLAVAAQPDAYYMFYHQARVLAKKGDKAGALAAAQHSIELAEKDPSPAKEEYRRLNQAVIDSLK
jgi:Protein of unknown function (DUF2911)